MPTLHDKIVLVTGASRGIGEAASLALAKAGAAVMLTARDGARIAAVAARIEAAGGRAATAVCDVSDYAAVSAVVAETVARFGRLDALINNAGVIEPIASVATADPAAWARNIQINLVGAFHCIRACLEKMRAAGGGTIVNVASIASIQGEPYVAAYCAAKGSVEALTRSVAVHCAQMRYNIRCNSIHPAKIETPLTADIPEKFKAAVKGGMTLPGQLGSVDSYTAQPEEIAPAVLYLACDASKYVNGTRLVIDNTMSITTGTVPA